MPPSDFIQKIIRLRPSAKTADKRGKIGFFEKCVIAFEKFFLFWVAMNILKDREVKLESAYSFVIKYSEITVC